MVFLRTRSTTVDKLQSEHWRLSTVLLVNLLCGNSEYIMGFLGVQNSIRLPPPLCALMSVKVLSCTTLKEDIMEKQGMS